MVGLAPLFSPFFVAVLEAAALHLVHLTQNAVLTLVVFVHTPEMFIGVQPSVELFRRCFNPYRTATTSPGQGATAQARTVGGYAFRRWRQEFIDMTFRNKLDN